MAIQTLNTIKNWFRTGLKPTQTQFWDTWDSFRHKNQKVPVGDVEGIGELLSSKTDKSDFKTINGESILGSGDIGIGGGGSQNLQQTLENGAYGVFNDDSQVISIFSDDPVFGHGAEQFVVTSSNFDTSTVFQAYPNGSNISTTVASTGKSAGVSTVGGVLLATQSEGEHTSVLRFPEGLIADTYFQLPVKPLGGYTLATTDDISLQKVLDTNPIATDISDITISGENGSIQIDSNGLALGSTNGFTLFGNKTFNGSSTFNGNIIQQSPTQILSNSRFEFYSDSSTPTTMVAQITHDSTNGLLMDGYNDYKVGLRSIGGTGGITLDAGGKGGIIIDKNGFNLESRGASNGVNISGVGKLNGVPLATLNDIAKFGDSDNIATGDRTFNADEHNFELNNVNEFRVLGLPTESLLPYQAGVSIFYHGGQLGMPEWLYIQNQTTQPYAGDTGTTVMVRLLIDDVETDMEFTSTYFAGLGGNIYLASPVPYTTISAVGMLETINTSTVKLDVPTGLIGNNPLAYFDGNVLKKSSSFYGLQNIVDKDGGKATKGISTIELLSGTDTNPHFESTLDNQQTGDYYRSSAINHYAGQIDLSANTQIGGNVYKGQILVGQTRGIEMRSTINSGSGLETTFSFQEPISNTTVLAPSKVGGGQFVLATTEDASMQGIVESDLNSAYVTKGVAEILAGTEGNRRFSFFTQNSATGAGMKATGIDQSVNSLNLSASGGVNFVKNVTISLDPDAMMLSETVDGTNRTELTFENPVGVSEIKIPAKSGLHTLATTDDITTSNLTANIGIDVPSAATSTGIVGQVRVDTNYLYVCTAINTWVRSPLTTW